MRNLRAGQKFSRKGCIYEILDVDYAHQMCEVRFTDLNDKTYENHRVAIGFMLDFISNFLTMEVEDE